MKLISTFPPEYIPYSARLIYRFRTALIALVLLCWPFLHFKGFAQNAGTYSFAASTRTYTPLTGATALSSSFEANDAMTGAIPLGFTFNFANNNYTSVFASTNGFLTFPNMGATPENNLATASNSGFTVIAPFWDNLDGSAATNSGAYYKTTGATGSRVFTFEWRNWSSPNSFDPVISMQVLLYETSGKIEFSYRQETGFPGLLSASIGIAAPAQTGPDILTLNNAGASPTASAGNTTFITSRPSTNQLYTFIKSSIKDIRPVALTEPTIMGCGFQPVTATIRNAGAVPLDFSINPCTVTVNIGGPNPSSLSKVVNSGILAINATQDVTVTNPPGYNMTTPGNYTFTISTVMTGDAVPANNTLAAITKTVAPIGTLPQNVNFTGFNNLGTNLTALFPLWSEARTEDRTGNTSNWENGVGLGNASNVTALMSMSAIDREWMISPKINAAATTILRFKAAITDYTNLAPSPTGMTGSDHEMSIMVSTDCGNSFSPLYTFNAANTTTLTNVLTDYTIPLGTYANQNIILAFYANGNTVTKPIYDFHLDDIFIGTPPAADLGVATVLTPIANGCYGNAETVSATITNYGSAPIDFSVTPANITAAVTGAVTINLTDALTGTLAVGASRSVTLSTPLNMTSAGVYNINVSVNGIAGDNNSANNTVQVTLNVAQTYSLPQFLDFTGYSGSNLPTLYPGWNEFKAGNGQGVADWYPYTGVGSAANITARIYLASDDEREWIIGPKITPAAGTELRFKAAITEWNNVNPDPVGMVGSDDKVQVMISTDCGVTYTPLYTFESSNTSTLTNVLTNFSFPLGAYAGQPVIIAFFATDGTIDNPNEYGFHIDDILITTPSGTDIGAFALANPVLTGCYGSAETLTATIKNFGSGPVTFSAANQAMVKTEVSLNGNLISTHSAIVSNGSLASGVSQNVTLSPALNMSRTGVYNFKTYTTFPGDTQALNDTMQASRTVAPVAALPNGVNFTGFTGANISTLFQGWYEATGTSPLVNTSRWEQSSSTQTTAFGSVAARLPFNGAASFNYDNWLIGPKFIATSASHLRFKAAATTSGGIAATAMTTNDTVFVMVSTNCGLTFQKFSALHQGSLLTNTMKQFDLNLSTLAGQQVIIAFYAKHGLPRQALGFDLHLDDIDIRNMFISDLRPVVLKTAISGCGLTSSENVCVVVKNEGTVAQSNIPVGFRVNNGSTTGLVIIETIPGPIAPGDTLRYCFTAKANLAAPAAYILQVFTQLAVDGFLMNDTISKAITSSAAIMVATVSATRCGAGTVNLTASNPNNIPMNWFAAATGGSALHTGNSYSPNVNATTTYYVEAVGGSEVTGKLSPNPTATTTNAGGLVFNAAHTFRLQSVTVYSNSAAGGTLTINLRNPANTASPIINTLNFTVPPVSGKTAITVPLNWNVPAGNGLILEKVGAINLTRDEMPATGSYFPITSPNQVVTITNGTLNGYYYFFYDWSISASCAVARTPVTANVNSALTVNLGADKAFCGSSGVLLNAGNTGAAFEWLFNNAILIGAASQTYSATAPGTYIVRVASGTCSASDTIVVTNIAAVGKPTITPSGPVTFCQGGAVTLTGASSTNGVTYIWLLNNVLIMGSNAASYLANASGNYRVIATLGSGCTDTSAVMAVIVTQAPATPTVSAAGPTAVCQGGSVTLTGSSTTSGVAYTWLKDNVVQSATGPVYTATASGNYQVVANLAGCSATSAVIALTINQRPAKPIITAGGATTFCQGGSVSLTGTSTTSGVAYSWLLNNAPISGTTAVYTANTSGNYRVVATLSSGCSDTSDVIAIQINPTPVTPVITQAGSVLTSSVANGNQWYVGGSPIIGATAASFTPTASGNYTVVSTVNGCASAVSNVISFVTSISRNLDGTSVSVFPNPNAGNFTVKLTGYANDAVVALYSLTGQKIKSIQVKAGNVETGIKAGQLPAGIYLLKVTSENRVNVLRVLVE